eukprot:CAMPEP_0172307890 /NCGR_PEP_ID=MMETSP1058-20130122/8654_1 /TAXON_ID=83371 /ORGANISM="Detonula confervacea, Strain CCMP 353" /LENGTH=280 /DNA_ID=CAMNT_0013020195 /DNA_START=73 /DNA_END=915 /DNA_ORIENTATION=-
MTILPSLSLSLLSIIGAGAVASYPGASSRPQLSITIRDGNFTDFESMDPTITWENNALLSNDVALQYGIDLSARTTNLAALPRRIWGRASRIFAGQYALSTRFELDVQAMDRIDFEIDGEDEENDLKMRVIGSTLTGFKRLKTARVSHMEFTKGFDNDGNRVTVNPRYNVDYQHADVVVTYDADDTLIKVTASKDDQMVTISQKLNDENMISPTIGRDGSLSLAWDRKLGEDNSIRTTLNPNRSIDLEWHDAAWTANVNFPMDENDLRGATVHIKRDIKF